MIVLLRAAIEFGCLAMFLAGVAAVAAPGALGMC